MANKKSETFNEIYTSTGNWIDSLKNKDIIENAKTVIVIQDCYLALKLALTKKVIYITFDKDKCDFFNTRILINPLFGGDDKGFFVPFNAEKREVIIKNILKNEGFDENMKADLIIGNPPYEGKQKLYLKILEKVKKFSEEIIWLCPTNWTDIPYKYWFENKDVIIKCLSFDCDFISEAKYFEDQGIPDNIGIYYFHKNGKTDMFSLYKRRFGRPDLISSILNRFEKYKNHLSEKMINCGGNRNVVNENDYAYVIGQWGFDTEINPKISGYYITKGIYKIIKDKNNLSNSYFEFNKNNIIVNKNKENISPGFFINFKTKKEVLNFCEVMKSPIILFSFYLIKFRKRCQPVIAKLVPYLNDYTHPWTDKEICKEIGLTKEEYNYICEEMKPYK